MQMFEELSAALIRFIEAQKVFFSASAPNEGRINLSPKGMDTFRCLDAHTVGYLDLTGSGNQTAAHLRQNGRMTMMFCSFETKPLILRLYGRGEVVAPGEEKWNGLRSQFPESPGVRQIILLHIDSVQTSCGYGVPNMEYKGDKTKWKEWAEGLSEGEMHQYRQGHNMVTIDGLPTGHREATPKPEEL